MKRAGERGGCGEKKKRKERRYVLGGGVVVVVGGKKNISGRKGWIKIKRRRKARMKICDAREERRKKRGRDGAEYL